MLIVSPSLRTRYVSWPVNIILCSRSSFFDSTRYNSFSDIKSKKFLPITSSGSYPSIFFTRELEYLKTRSIPISQTQSSVSSAILRKRSSLFCSASSARFCFVISSIIPSKYLIFPDSSRITLAETAPQNGVPSRFFSSNSSRETSP